MKNTNEQLYVRGPHIKYIITALTIGFGIVVGIAAILITALSLLES